MARARRPSGSAEPDASRREHAGAAAGGLPAAARMLLAGVLALTALRVLAAFVPGRWMWGIDLGRDLPAAAFAAGLAVTALACVPAAGRWFARRWGSGHERVVTAVCAVALALFAWNSPDRALYTGDASLRHGAFAQVSNPEILAEQALRGDLVLHHAVPRWVADHTPWTSDQGGRALGALLAGLTVFAGWRLATTAGARGMSALAAAAIAACSGALALDNGYGKASVEVAALTSVMAVGVVRLTQTGSGLGAVGVPLGLALLLHRSSLTLLPVWLAGVVVAARAGRLRSREALAGLAAPVLALAVTGPRLWAVISTFDATHHAAGGVGATLAAMLSPLRVLDSVNTLLLLVPLVAMLPLLVALRPRFTRLEAALAVVFVLPPLALLFVVQLQHELPRDWDVFAFTGAAVAAVAAWRVAQLFAARPPLRVAAPALLLAAALPALQWASLQSDPERLWTRAESILAGPPARRASDIADGLGTIGMMRLGRGQAEAALKLFERSAEAAPNPRIFVQAGMAETVLGRPDRAMERYLYAASLNPDLNTAWRGVAAAASALGDRERMLQASVQLARLEPGGSTLQQAREWLEANPAK